MKKCSKCFRELAESEYYDNHHPCKDCAKKYFKARWQKIKDNPIVKENRKIYRLTHRETILKGKKEYYIKNREKLLSKTKEWVKNNKDKRKIICRRWQLKKKQTDPNYFVKVNQKYKNWKTNYTRQYRKKNRAWNLIQKLKRRLREKNGKGITIEDILTQLKLQNEKCFYCKKDISNSYTIDHKLALSKGGLNNKENMVLACLSCNCKKGVKDFQAFNTLEEGINFIK